VSVMCTPLIVARQRLGRQIPAATNTRNNRRLLLEASLSMRPFFYQRNVSDNFLRERLVEMFSLSSIQRTMDKFLRMMEY
jgi:hypothetical protein